MNRRQFILSSTTFALGAGIHARASGYGGFAGLAAQAPAQPAAAPLVTKFEDLRRGVGMFIATGGTIGYLVNADGAIAVDSQFMPNATICAAGLKQRAPKGIAMLINTHHHGDHTGGNKAYGVSQDRRARELPQVASSGSPTEGRPSIEQAYASTTFKDTWSEKFGDETIEARYFGPGHTGGDAVIHFQRANVMHMGDLLFNRAHPNIDRAQGARIDNWITVLETVAKRASNDTIFIAGHAKDNDVRNGQGRVDALPQLPDRGARTRPCRREGGAVEGRDPEAAGAEGIRRHGLPERAAVDGLRARHCLRRSDERETVTGIRRSGNRARDQG